MTIVQAILTWLRTTFSIPAELNPVDPYALSVPENICDPVAKPGVKMFRDYWLSKYGGYDLGIIRECGGSNSGHTAGMAWDWGVLAWNGHAKIQDPQAALDWLLANDREQFRRAGLMYMIYNQRIWSVTTKSWQPYKGASAHIDHVHFSFGKAGAMGETSFYKLLKEGKKP